VTVEIRREPGARAGLALYYSPRLYCGLGFDDAGLVMHRYGLERRRRELKPGTERLFIRMRNDRHIVTFFLSEDGKVYQKFDVQMETSGYHHNVAYEFLSLKPALYVTGSAAAEFRALTYRALA
jgi:beta-xylosidase